LDVGILELNISKLNISWERTLKSYNCYHAFMLNDMKRLLDFCLEFLIVLKLIRKKSTCDNLYFN